MGWVEPLMRCVEIVACGSPPARGISELVSLAQADRWDPFVTLSPSATKWASIAHLERQTGYPVRTEFRTPDEELPVPASDAVVACPVTVNTVNKWAAGICDTLALGTLVEAIGRGVPIVAVPFSNPAHLAHPAFRRNLRDLSDWGVRVVMLDSPYMDSSAWDSSRSPGQVQSPWEIAIAELRRAAGDGVSPKAPL
jgi:phosphopantothenoylcysteine synthetase/decarboxylase